MRLQGTVTNVEPDKIVVQLPNYKCVTVRRNDTDRWQKNSLTVWHVIAIRDFDERWNPAARRDILGMQVEVSTDHAGIVRVAGG
jgi:hypothetical protein